MNETLTTNSDPRSETGNGRFTNRENLPQPIVRAVTNDPYSKGKADFSVTELLQPARIRALVKEHRNEIVEDVSDRLWALMGQVGHTILERAGDDSLVERRFFSKVVSFTISGQADLIMRETEINGETALVAELIDYKFCSVWTMLNGIKPEWTQQVNILRYLALNDFTQAIDISQANIVAIFRDWSKPKAGREKGYPQSQVNVFPVKLWSLEQTEKFICERIAAHITAEKHLPLCTDDERWRTPAKWALMKKGNKRAARLFNTQPEAEKAVSENNTNFPRNQWFVEHRPGESKRCEFYCLAAPFCTQFKQEKATI